MEILRTVEAVRGWRAATAGPVGLVPTMGNLHAGHMALVEAARAQCARVVASIFVNPLQFGPGEDLATYPRTFEADRAALSHAGVAAVFAPGVADMYPDDGTSATIVRVSGLTGILCGRGRPGHFEGVATVVTKLFNIVTPDRAFFGEKDYQQLAIIRRMVADLCLPVRIEGVPTVREANGLAYSSRNHYLDAAQRRQAAALSAALADVVARLRAGQRDFRGLEARGWALLADAGFEPEYFEIRTAALDPATADSRNFRVLAAGRLGRTRLIDNMGVAVEAD